jgi:hypothetical protein
MADPTREDAMLLVQLAQLGSGLGDARSFVWSEAFVSDADEFKEKYPLGSKESGYIPQLAGFFETVATLWKHQLISEELLFDWLAVTPVWERLKDILTAQREEAGTPQLWENFEALAEAQVAAGARV